MYKTIVGFTSEEIYLFAMTIYGAKQFVESFSPFKSDSRNRHMSVAHLSILSASVNRAHEQQNAWTRLEGEAGY